MKSMSENTFKLYGSVRTYIVFSKGYSFKIGTKYVLDIPTGKVEDGTSKFELVGKVSTDDLQTAKTEGFAVLDSFLGKLSIFFNVPIESLTISDTRLGRNNGTNVATSERSVEAKGAIAVNDTNIDYFDKVLNIKIDDNILSMFKRCRSENPDISFWTIYDILQILIGERTDIDKYLKANFPELPILHNDKLNQDNTILIAIRDSFSHKTTYSGKSLNVNLEIQSNIDKFRNIARDTIVSKLGLAI
jgi:hypothetical protein